MASNPGPRLFPFAQRANRVLVVFGLHRGHPRSERGRRLRRNCRADTSRADAHT